MCLLFPVYMLYPECLLSPHMHWGPERQFVTLVTYSPLPSSPCSSLSSSSSPLPHSPRPYPPFSSASPPRLFPFPLPLPLPSLSLSFFILSLYVFLLLYLCIMHGIIVYTIPARERYIQERTERYHHLHLRNTQK